MQPDSTVQWSAYPALALALCLAVGIALAAALPGVSLVGWLIAVGTAALATLLANRVARGRLVSPAPLLRTASVALLAVAVGGTSYANRCTLPADHVAHLLPHIPADADVTLEGRLTGDAARRGTRMQFTVDDVALIGARDTTAASGTIQVTVYATRRHAEDSPLPYLSTGDIVRLYGRLRAPQERHNPADFDYRAYLQRRNIYTTFSVYGADRVTLRGRRRSSLEHVVGTCRAFVRAQFTRYVPSSDARAVLGALVLGDRSGLDAETRGHFSRTGLMHVLAVSGLHVFLVGMLLYALLRPLLMRLRFRWRAMEVVRSVLTLMVLLLYMLIAGAGASVVRAVVMAALFIGGTLLQRSAHPLNTLGVAGVVLLVLRPAHLFDVGFQLSFAAVAAIVTLHRVFEARVPEAWMAHPGVRWTANMVLVSAAATLGTLPVLLHHFGHVSFAGLVLNLAAIPLTTATLASGVATVLFGGWWPAAAQALGAASGVLTRLLLGTASVGDRVLGWASMDAYVDDPWLLSALVAGIIMTAQWPRPRNRWRMAATGLCFLGMSAWWSVATNASRPALEVVFFDVAHGDAALVSLPNGRHLLIDTGGADAYVDQGRRTVLPHLKRFGIGSLDAVVITHPHSDHLGGLATLVREVPVGRVLNNGKRASSELFAETNRLLDSLAVPTAAVQVGDTLVLDPTVRIQVLAPAKHSGDLAEANDASIVLLITYGTTRFLFLGDVEADAEHRLVDRFGPMLASDVVKVGHHGSRTSSTADLVAAATYRDRPPLAVVSVGKRFGLPNDDVLARWRARQARLWTTVDRGALWVRSDGNAVRRVSWR